MNTSEQIQFKILRTIEHNPQTTQRELARMLGVSNGKAHYLMAALVEKGLLKIDSFSRNDGKTGKVAYLLTPEGIKNRAGLTKAYLARKEEEYEALWVEIKALRNEEPQLPKEIVMATGVGRK
ncbi:MAG: MarR family EPS-associated transcriptional regulator [Sideroxyarcus sp.]|nr:MarR family EPS-associated transcriptional regulator [Sideroxyarcus sp.]